MTKDLKNKTINGVFWQGCENIGIRGLQFVIGIILARLLLPAEFGIIAILMIFISLSQVFVSSGLGMALIQRKEVNHSDECTVFYFNIIVACVFYVLLFITAPIIAEIYNNLLLCPTLRLLGTVIIINAFSQIQRAILSKKIDFKRQFVAGIISVASSGVVAVSMAYKGYGVWALVFQQLSLSIIRTALFWIFNSWRPALIFSFSALKRLFGFSSKMLISGLLDTAFNHIYTLVIGLLYSPTSLGLYNRGKNIPFTFMGVVSSSIGSVAFPVYSKIQNDPVRVKKITMQFISVIMTVVFPLMIGLCIVAKNFVIIVLTAKWLPCVPYLQAMCIVFVIWPLHVINLQVMTGLGRSDIFLKLEFIKKVFIIIGVLLTFWISVYAMVLAQIGISFLSLYLNCYYTKKIINYSLFEQFKDIFPSFLLTVVMASLVYFAGFLPIKNIYIMFLLQIFIGGIVYIGLGVAFKVKSFSFVYNVICDRIFAK